MSEQEDDSMNDDSWLYGDNDGTGPTPDAGGGEVPPGDSTEVRRDSSEKEKSEETVPPPLEHNYPSDEPPPPGEAPLSDIDGLLPRPFNEDDEPGVPGDDTLPPGELRDADESGVADGESKSIDGAPSKEPGQAGGEDDEEDEDDDSEDDIRVTIGDIKTAPPQYSNINIKRGANLAAGIDKMTKQGKFSIEEFESIGAINGVPAHEFSIDALEDKPWRKPGADITDYFNYGFNEETWRAYCERQKHMRIHESGVGLGGLGVSRPNPALTVINDNSKYANNSNVIIAPGVGGPVIPSSVVQAQRKAGPPPGPRRSGGFIDVIGSGVASRRATDSPPKENVIQVMTADRRDYARKGFDMSVPPPGFEGPPPQMPPVMPPAYPPHGYPNYPPGGYDVDPYYGGYEPPHEMQWNPQVRSSRHRERRSSRRSSLSPSDSKRYKSDKYSHTVPLNKDPMELPGGITIKQEPPEKTSSSSHKERDRSERERSERHKDRHRHRSRSRSTDRERRSSRKHKSRSRSPSHRSHKKKKSKKSDRKETSSD